MFICDLCEQEKPREQVIKVGGGSWLCLDCQSRSDPNEPYPFGTHVLIKPHNRHELPDALVYGHCTTTDGYRYNAIFPFAGGLRFANVYSDEIADVLGLDEIETARLLEVSR